MTYVITPDQELFRIIVDNGSPGQFTLEVARDCNEQGENITILYVNSEPVAVDHNPHSGHSVEVLRPDTVAQHELAPEQIMTAAEAAASSIYLAATRQS